MLFVSGLFQTIILLGAIQGFIICILLFYSKKNRQSDRLLAVLILLMSLASINLYGNYRNWFGSNLLRLVSDIVPLIIVMPFGPLIYLYTRSYLDPGFHVTKKQLVHFYPVVIDIVPQFTAVIYIIGVILQLVPNNPGSWVHFIDNYNVYADIPRWMATTGYLWLTSINLSAVKANNQNVFADQMGHFTWLQQFLRVFLIFQVIWFVYLIPYVIPRYSNALLDAVNWYPIYVPLAIMIYWLGIKGYLISQQQHVAVKKIAAVNVALSTETVEHATVSLKKAMEVDQLYFNPNMNLAMLAQQTGIPQKVISSVLNQHFHKSFNEFINDYRVEAFKKKILQPENDHLTIAGIASDCGFNSVATFQRTFKETTGMSPSEFRKKII